MKKSPPSSALIRRLLLWVLPLLAGLGLVAGHNFLEADATVEHGEQLLAEGRFLEAKTTVEPWQDHVLLGAKARAVLRVAAAFSEDSAAVVSDVEKAGLDAGELDLPLIVRAAFERAEFGAVLRLTELAEDLGQPTVPWVTLAAQIESGSLEDSARHKSPGGVLTTGDGGAKSLLIQRVTHHLGQNGAQGIAIRDRTGQPIGRLQAGELSLSRGIRPEWIPKAVSRFAEAYSEAGSVRASLDLELSKAAFESFGRFRGSIVLVDTLTGEILAAVSDRRTHRREQGTPAFEQAREPASIAKLITTAAYIRHGLDPDKTLRSMSCNGHDYYD